MLRLRVTNSQIKITTERGGSVIPCSGDGSIYARLSPTSFIDLIKSRYRESAQEGEMWIKFNIDSARVSIDGAAARVKEIGVL